MDIVMDANEARERVLQAKSTDLVKALKIIQTAADGGHGSIAMDVSHLNDQARAKLKSMLSARNFGVEESVDVQNKITVLTVDWV